MPPFDESFTNEVACFALANKAGSLVFGISLSLIVFASYSFPIIVFKIFLALSANSVRVRDLSRSSALLALAAS